MKSFSLLGSLSLLTSLSWALPTEGVTSKLEGRQSGSSWFLPNIDHTTGAVRGYVPNLFNSAGQQNFTYPVYKTVASGDSAGFVNALYSDGPSGGQRDNCYLAGEPRVIYLPPGTYTVSSTIFFDTDTVIIGDAANPPTIKAAAGFNGNYLIVGGQGDGSDHPCGGSGGETHFSVMIKNVILDTTANAGSSGFTALSWAVAQNCALVNVKINMPQGVHTGMLVSGGSTISISDVSFNFGNIGLHWNGHQQGQIKGMTFTDCTNGIFIDSGFTISIFAPTCNTVGRCIVLNSGNAWVAVIDGKSINSGDFFTSNVGFPNFMLENISKDTTNSNMVVVGGNVKVGGSTSLGTYVYGNTRGANPVYQTNPTSQPVNRPAALAPGGRYPVISAPQYADKTVANVVNLKDPNQNGGHTLQGDGFTDDTAALQGALNTAASQGKIAYLPFGIYIVKSTITIPPGTELYGEAWSTISGSGSAFSSETNPTPVVQIGATPGQKGVAHVQDIRFTVNEALPGAILLRINMAGNNPGDVAVFNSLNTIGGTRDTSISCNSESNCRAAYLGLHLAAGSSAYIDNFWSWVADHATDQSGKGTRTAVKGGVLVEATAGTWLTGLGSEHNWLYQLSFHNAANVFISLFQSETNYNQGNNGAPLPGTPFDATSIDPNFSWCSGGDTVCRMGLAQYYTGSNSNIFHYAAGSWNFIGLTKVNQGLMNFIQSTISNAHLYGFTSGPNTGETMRLPNGVEFGNGGNDGYGGSWGTLIANIASQS
ncbi:family 55 glycoside hydrolase [Trichoderma longibrachiatum]|uniref:Glycoside hydrolase family 55 protein n=1 Tax=Trichoderma longibrachiatum ATCC 18648 TaxID=983965 RepID=A0A2T4BP73_TRILO|nr:glycoside hydrolase family 55 protein [Trichoderma longibrachiatum ATCC 18648]